MIATLTIKNFLSLKNVKLNLSKKTYLVGENNSGKTAVSKALQFVNANAIKNSSNIKTNFQIDNETDLGTYSDIVFNHEEDKSIYFRFDCRLNFEEYSAMYDSGDNHSKEMFSVNGQKDDIIKQLETNSEIADTWNSDELASILISILEVPSFYKSLLKDKFSGLAFSFKVIFSPDVHSQHLKKVEVVDNNTFARISFKPDIFSRFNNSNAWKIKLKLFEDENVNSIFKKLQARLNYIFHYYPVDFSDITRVFIAILLDFIEEDLDNNEVWNNFTLKKKKEIISSALIQLIRFYKYFNVVVRAHFSIFKFSSLRNIPRHKYLLKNDSLPIIKDYGDLNNFLSKEEAVIISSAEESDKFIETITEPEHMAWSETFYFLQQLKLAKYCYLKKAFDTGELRVVNMDGLDHNITESGKGLLYILPIIYKIYERFWKDIQNNYIFIEQPEIHLHASKHLFLESLFNYKDTFLIIETHSEQLIGKLQQQISKGEIKKQDISILYFSKQKDQTKVKNLILTEHCIFKTFFPLDYFEQTSLAAKQLTQINLN